MKRLHTAATLGAILWLMIPGALQAQEPDEEEVRVQERVVRARVAGSGGYLGVTLRDVREGDVTSLGLPGEYGAVIERVREESPAAEAGLSDNDVVVSWNGERVESVAALSRLVRETPPGRSVRLGVLRGGSQQTIAVTLGDRADMAGALAYSVGPEMRERMKEVREHAREAREHARELRQHLRTCSVEVDEDDEGGVRRRIVVVGGGGRARLGVRLQGLTDQLGGYFGVEDGHGALVTSVSEDSPAAAAGVQAGDVIVAVGSTTVESVGDVARAVHDAEAGPVEVGVVRDGQRRSLTATLEERGEEEECENFFVAPEGSSSFEWRSDDGHAFVLPDGAVAPYGFQFAIPTRPHGVHVLPAPLHPAHPPLAPRTPNEVDGPPAPPAAPVPVQTV